MRKISVIFSTLLLSTSVYAGDAPTDAVPTGVSLNVGGEVMVEATSINNLCGTPEADPVDIFSNELNTTNQTSINTDLETLGFASGSSIGDVAQMGMAQSYCPMEGLNTDTPHFVFEKELFFDVTGKLANGLVVSFKETLDLTDTNANEDAFELSLGGAFGTILIQDDTNAVDKMLIGTAGSGAKTAYDGSVLSNHTYAISDGHKTSTSGSEDGLNLIYFTPSFAGLDLAFGYNKNTDNLGLDNSEFNDTYSVGFGYETFIGDVVLSLGGGFEKAISDTDTSANCLTTDLAAADAANDSGEFFDGLYGSSKCGNETLSAIGADIGYGEFTVSSAFSNLDTTDGSDISVWSVGIARTFNDIDYTVGYSKETLDYARNKVNGDEVQDTSKIMMLEATKPLGEGVDLGLNFSNAEIDRASEELGNGPEDAWRAGVSVTLGF